MSGNGPPSTVRPNHSELHLTLAAISRRMVGLLKEYYGKGPTKARTYILDDLVVVLLSGASTTLESTLVQEGRGKLVLEQRAEFQDVMRQRFKRVVEEELHREVLAFMSASHFDPDYAVEVFVLSPDATAASEVGVDTTLGNGLGGG